MHEIDADHVFGTVALLGPPNAGKSTLLNAILGQKLAIVTPKPQTTRNRISGILSEPGAQVVFLDTPGVHRSKGRLNRMLNQAAWTGAESADVMVVVVDADLYARKPGLLDRELGPLVERIAKAPQPLLVAVNKEDAVKDKKKILPVLQRVSVLWPRAELFPISALKEKGLEPLLSKVKGLLPKGPPMFPEDQVSTVPLRFMAAETVREKLFMALSQELPYSLTVEIESWEEEPERNLVRVGALIFVARPNHKAMVIGKGGRTLKDVGIKARVELEEMLESRVHLELFVKVRTRWTEDMNFLRTLGFGD